MGWVRRTSWTRFGRHHRPRIAAEAGEGEAGEVLVDLRLVPDDLAPELVRRDVHQLAGRAEAREPVGQGLFDVAVDLGQHRARVEDAVRQVLVFRGAEEERAAGFRPKRADPFLFQMQPQLLVLGAGPDEQAALAVRQPFMDEGEDGGLLLRLGLEREADVSAVMSAVVCCVYRMGS